MSTPSESLTSCLRDGQFLSVGDHKLVVRVSARRSRLGLTVERDGTVTLRVPEGCGRERAERFTREHHSWIAGKLTLRNRLQPLHTPRALVDGEVFRYLGRAYRLLLVDGPQGGGVRMVSGRLALDRTAAADPARGRGELITWYSRAGLGWARGRLQPWAARLDVPDPAVAVRDLGLRWGSYTPGDGPGAGRIALNWAVFQLPTRIVDYVIAHELAHIRIAGHGPDYWRLLRRAIPEHEVRKAELDDLGRRVWTGEVAERREQRFR